MPWTRSRRVGLVGDGAQAWLFVLVPIAVAIGSMLLMAQVSKSARPQLAHGELVGRLRTASAAIGAQVAEVARGHAPDRNAVSGDLERMEGVLADIGDLRTVPAWREQPASASGARHLEQFLGEWPEVREAVLGAAAPADGVKGAESARTTARRYMVSFPAIAGQLAGDLEAFSRDERADHQARIDWLFVLLIAALFTGAALRALDLLVSRRRQRELQRLSLVAESTGSSVVLADGEGRALWANDAFLRTTGWEEVAGQTLCGLICEDPNEIAHAELTAAIARCAPHHGEYELRRRDGRTFWAGVELMPLSGDAGSPHQFMLMFSDITRRVTATHQLAASEARFRSALAALSEGLVLYEADGTVVQCNESALRILGLTEDQLLHTPPAQRTYPCFGEDGRRIPLEELPAAVTLRTGVPQRGVLLGIDRPSGDRVWVSVDTSPFPLPGSARPGVVSTFADITARRAAEQSVRSLTQVVEECPTMVLLTDADNRIEYVNASFEACTGYSLAEAGGRAPSFMLSELTPPETWDSLGKALSEGQYWRGEIHNLARDGSTWLSDSQVFALRDPSGAVTHYVALMRDITEQRRRERELSAAREDALAAARAKTEFLQNVSHELRTPLNGIMGMSELLMNSALDAGQRADLVQLRSSADDLLTVVTHLFDFVQVESGTAGSPSTPFRLRGALAEIEGVLGAGAEARNLRWSVTVEAGVPDALVGDPGALRRVLQNLASNAVKFTERGEVALEIGVVRVADDSVTLRFAMRDTGIGIAEERQAGIFEAFAQVDGSTTRRYGGIGLGLALASRLVRQMGGLLKVESGAGAGSTFSFELSLGRAPATAEAPAPAPGPASPLAGGRVLVASGAAEVRARTRTVLERDGAEVLAGSAAGDILALLAVRQAEGRPVSALVIDQRDARIDGFALLESLQGSGAPLPPAILVTSAGHRGDGERCRRLGIAGYLAAPAGDAEIVDTLRHLLAPREAGTPALVTRHLLREERQRRRVLLVDDNAVNRKVGSRLLERAGYDVVTAVDGREGLGRFLAGGWDLVLMDVQMPEMDGVEATRLIREHERDRGLTRTPILALTAHTLEADRRTVLEAGMDDLVSKPIQPDDLVRAMQRHLALVPLPAWAEAGAPELADVIDRDEALERMDGDEDLLNELLRIFRDDAGAMLQRLDAADASADARQLERAAHSLKGASATISARHVSGLAAEIERLAREDHLNEARDRMDDLRREFRQLVRALESVPMREAA
jgi:PAS domain S-box-containing protein